MSVNSYPRPRESARQSVEEELRQSQPGQSPVCSGGGAGLHAGQDVAEGLDYLLSGGEGDGGGGLEVGHQLEELGEVGGCWRG